MSEGSTLLYVYDALCSWCYGFDPVLMRLRSGFQGRGFAGEIRLVSGGMCIGPRVEPVKSFIGERWRAVYKRIAEHSGANIAEPYLEDLVERRNYLVDSERPAIAMAAFRDLPGEADRQLDFAFAMQTAMYAHGIDPADDAYYRHAAAPLGIDADDLLARMSEPRCREEAHADFALARRLGANGFPQLFLLRTDGRLVLLARGFAPYEEVEHMLERGLALA